MTVTAAGDEQVPKHAVELALARGGGVLLVDEGRSERLEVRSRPRRPLRTLAAECAASAGGGS